MNTISTLRKPSRVRLTAIMCLASLLLTACASGPDDSRAKQGAKSGAAWGAGIGLLLGVLADDPARGMAAGAAYGAGVGAYEGWRQDQDDERTREVVQAISASRAQQTGLDAESRQREELTRFLGVWRMSGWVVDDGQRMEVSAQVNGNVHMNYFVQMAWIDLQLEGFDGQIWGTSTLGYDANSGYSLSTRFNTSPDALEVQGGTFSGDTRTFRFSDAAGTTTLEFSTPDRFTVTTMAGGETVESYTFSRT
jgi:hypothetical protein